MARFDLREIRKDRLQQLIDKQFNGSQVAFAKAANRSPTQVNHWLSGHRNPNGDTCRSVEEELKLPTGWLDQAIPEHKPTIGGIPPHIQSRLAQADPVTMRLIEMALFEDDEEAAKQLTPSLVAMVRALKAMMHDQDAAS